MQNFWRGATSQVAKIELLNDRLITLSISSLDDPYPLDQPLMATWKFRHLQQRRHNLIFSVNSLLAHIYNETRHITGSNSSK